MKLYEYFESRQVGMVYPVDSDSFVYDGLSVKSLEAVQPVEYNGLILGFNKSLPMVQGEFGPVWFADENNITEILKLDTLF